MTPSCVTRVVRIPAYGASLTAELAGPIKPRGFIIVVDSATTPSARAGDREIVGQLKTAGFVTLRLDLLTPAEELIEAATRGIANDLPLLAQRLMQTIEWASLEPSLEGLPIGLFLTGHAAGAGLVATVAQHVPISAIVALAEHTTRGGASLERTNTPVLFIVAGSDVESVRENETAFARLHSAKQMLLVDSAGHGFREPGAIDEVAKHAVAWFEQYLSRDM